MYTSPDRDRAGKEDRQTDRYPQVIFLKQKKFSLSNSGGILEVITRLIQSLLIRNVARIANDS